MENIKEKLPIVIAVFLAIGICVIAIYLFEFKTFDYYTQIDNTKVKSLSTTDDMKYEYTLDCYTTSGSRKEICFKTSRQLREGAYLKLTVRWITGVNHWEEVQQMELPKKVSEKYER